MVEVLASYKIAETDQGYQDIYNDDYDNLVLCLGGRETKKCCGRCRKKELGQEGVRKRGREDEETGR